MSKKSVHKNRMMIIGRCAECRPEKGLSMNNTKREVAERLKNFFRRNRDYAVELDLKDSQTHAIIGIFSISMNRECSSEDNLLSISLKNNECIYEALKIRYDDVISIHEEQDEFGIQTVLIEMRCGFSMEFTCVGIRI